MGLFVVNGESSTQNSIHTKHVVKLTYRSHCSGTIIADNAILTAAHCEQSFRTISFGLSSETRTAVAAIIHSDYVQQNVRTPDIAIVFFDGGLPEGFEPMPLAESMDTVCLLYTSPSPRDS